MSDIQIMKPFINGQYIESKSQKYNDIFDPSTGKQIAKVPCCTQEEVEQAIAAAKAAFPAWKDTPVRKRAAIMMKLRNLPKQMRNCAWVFDFIPMEVSVVVEAGAEVVYSILMPGAKVCGGARVAYAIIGENTVVDRGDSPTVN